MTFPVFQPATPRQRERARSLRKAMTDDERRLWIALRQRLPLAGTHFRRQVNIGPSIVDFCCMARRLVVEVDGNQHGTDQSRTYDARRTALIESHGFRVLRFANEDVRAALDSVLDTIAAALGGTPASNFSPQGGVEEAHLHA